MKPELLTLILNIVFIAILALGFLFGLKGVKKATSSLCSFIITMVVVIFLSAPISQWVLSWNFGGKSLELQIIDAINSIFGESIASNPTMQQLIKGIPVAIVSIVVCTVLILVLGAIFKIIGAIIYKVIFGKNDKKVVEEVQIVNDAPQMTKKTIKPKKYRLLGGLIGLVHGLLLCFVLFMPIIGVVNIVNEVAGTNTASADVITEYNTSSETIVLTASEGGTTFELKPAKDLLKENLPPEFYSYAGALDNSILAKVGKIGNMSDFSLNLIARTNINGQTIKLGQEIRTLVKVYDEFVDFATEASATLGTSDINAIFNDIVENPNNYDFNKLYTICDDLFDSGLVKAFGNDLLKTIADSLVESNKENADVMPYLLHIQTAVNNYCAGNYNLKDDVKAVLGVFEISAKSGLIKAIQTEPFNIDNVANVLLNEQTTSKPKNEVLTNLAGKITGSNLLQKAVIEATNYGSSYLQDLMNKNIQFNENAKVVLPTIDGSKDIRVNSTELVNLVSNGYKVYKDVYEPLDFNTINENFYNIFNYDLKPMIIIVGNELDTIVNMQIFKDTRLFSSICEAMSNSEYSKYLSFNELAKGSNIKDQFGNLAESVNEIKSSNVITLLKNMNAENQNDTIDLIIDELATVNSSNVTLATRVLNPILSCSILKNTICYGLDSAHSVIESSLNSLVAGENITIAPFNTSTINSDIDRQQILNIINKLVTYAKDIKIADLQGDTLLDSIMDSNLTALGTALDEVKNANLFSTVAQGKSYNDMIKALSKSDFNKFLDFTIATDTSYSWKTELTSLQTAINTINNTIVIPTASGDKGLIKFMLNGGNFNEAYNYINSTNAMTLQPIFEIKLIKPVAVNVVNTINMMIKDFVGEDLGKDIKEITDITAVDLSLQAKEITEVIASAVDIDFNETNLDNIDKTKLNILLSKLEVNAKNNGVFKDSYNALLLKVADMINENVKSFVGDAGNKITKIANIVDVLQDSQNIIAVLNCALDTVKTLKSADFKNIDTNQLFVLIDALKVNSTIINGAFKNTYNSVMVYIVNKVNSQIADFVGPDLATEIVSYDGNTDMTQKYNYIKEILECAVSAYKAIPVGGVLSDIDSTTLGNLLDALDSMVYTRKAYNALNNKLANVVIESVNSIIGSSVATITAVKDLNLQATDIKTVVDVCLDVSAKLEGMSFKIADMSDEDKANSLKLLNAIQTNGEKSDGVFKPTYDALVNYIATENGTTSEVIYTNFAQNGSINWSSFLNANVLGYGSPRH